MPRHYTYMPNESGEVAMLICRHESALPVERQEWGGLAPESTRDIDEVLQMLSTYGATALKCVELGAGGSAVLIDENEPLNQLRQQFGYTLKVSPDVGLDMVGGTSEGLVDIFGKDSRDEGLRAEKWSLCVIKPDAKKRGMERIITDEIQSRGLHIRDALANIALTGTHLDQLWPAPLAPDGTPLPPSPWWGATVAYMTEAPVDVLLTNGENASNIMKDIKTDLRREVYGLDYQSDPTLSYNDRVRSVIHSSDCNRELITNVAAFWSSSEIEQIVRKEEQ